MKSPSSPQNAQPSPESLRERKKRLTRETIFATADRLFAQRGFAEVTVAEIADAANISVKTLFSYVGAKEELLFSGGPTVLDAAVDETDPHRSLDAFVRLAASGPAARSRLRALWDETEDALTAVLTTHRDGPRELAARRLTAAQIMVLVRTVTSAEVGDLITKEADTELARRDAVRDWIRDAAGQLARGLQAAVR